MVVKSEALRSDTFPNSLFRVAVGDDGGTERSDSGATPFRTLDIGWLVGIDGGFPSGALRSDTFPTALIRVVGGVSGGT